MARLDPFEFVDPRTGRRITVDVVCFDPKTVPVVVSVVSVIACVYEPDKWFAVKLDTGELTIARVDVVTKVWTQVPEWRWPSLAMNGGLPEKCQTVRCPVCDVLVDILFPCSKHVDELYADCPGCGYRFDVEQAIHADDDDGGTGEL